MARNITVTLGGQSYQVNQLPIKAAREWRTEFQKPFEEIALALSGAGSIELTDGKNLGGLLDTLRGVLLRSPDTLLEMLYAYSPLLKADSARIEAEAFDDEVMLAFVEVLRLAYPFESLMSFLSGLGSKATETK